MQISNSDWLAYIRKLKAVDQKAADAMQYWMENTPDADVDELIYTASLLSQQYGEAAAALACEMYDACALAQGVALPPAEPAPTATYQEVAKAVQGTIKNRRNSVPDTVGRLVKQAGADTMLHNAQRDGAQFAWVPMGDTCSFCIILASRGWQRQSKKAAKSHAEHIHPHCDCTYAVRFDGKSTIEGYDPDVYLRQYENADGATWQEKMNSMRRDYRAANRDRINEQRRIRYAEIKKNVAISEKRSIILSDGSRMNQKGDVVAIPENYRGDFSDYEELALSQQERSVFELLYKSAAENGVEFGVAFVNGQASDLFTSNEFDRVNIPDELLHTNGIVKLFHSHTNETPPSLKDLSFLTYTNVEEIGVIAINGDVYVVAVGDGMKIDASVFEEDAGRIYNEVTLDLINYPEFSEWSPSERNYMAIREQFYRISRLYGWTMKGGRL